MASFPGSNPEGAPHLPLIQEVWKQIASVVSRKQSRRYISKTLSVDQSRNISFYEQAKNAETLERNLEKALKLYAASVNEGERIDSCIKDVASIIHQLGHTVEAVKFLGEMREHYRGDINRFDRLATTLERQLKPSFKHECRAIALELP